MQPRPKNRAAPVPRHVGLKLRGRRPAAATDCNRAQHSCLRSSCSRCISRAKGGSLEPPWQMRPYPSDGCRPTHQECHTASYGTLGKVSPPPLAPSSFTWALTPYYEKSGKSIPMRTGFMKPIKVSQVWRVFLLLFGGFARRNKRNDKGRPSTIPAKDAGRWRYIDGNFHFRKKKLTQKKKCYQ